MDRFDVSRYNTTNTLTTYHIVAKGLNNSGEEIEVSLSKWPDSCSCNPWHWEEKTNNYPSGHSFVSLDEAKLQMDHAGMSYNVKSVDITTAKVYKVDFTETRTCYSYEAQPLKSS